MIMEKNHAGILVYEIIDGYLKQRYYVGYTLKEARTEFKREFSKNEGRK